MFLTKLNVNSRNYLLKIWNTSPYNVRNKSTTEKIILFGDEVSPPVRFVMMTAWMLNIDYTFHKIDLFKEENKTDFYRQVNPLQKVPALAVNGEVICDSHAIALYLCRKVQHQNLYPSDPVEKAKVDRMLFFNAANLFPVDSFIFTEYFAGKKQPSNEKIKEWHFYLKHLNSHLAGKLWLAGDEIQLCDICCGATISSLELLIPAIEKYAFVKSWMERLQKLPCFEINNNGLKRLNSFVKLCSS